MDRYLSDSLDRWITGNYGEDSFYYDNGCVECDQDADFITKEISARGKVMFFPLCVRCAMNYAEDSDLWTALS